MDEFMKEQQIVYGFLHDIALAVYIGGAVAMELVLSPAQKAIPPAQAQVMGQKSADRFLWLVWGSLAVIIVSGALRLWRLGFFQSDFPFIEDTLGLDVSYGRTFWALFLCWILLVVNGLIITFILRPRLAGRMSSGVTAARAAATQDVKIQAARHVEILTRVDIGIALLAAFFGASLKWGGIL